MRQKTVEEILAEKIIMIVRGYRGDTLMSLLEAAYDGGIRFAEITYDAKGEPSDAFTAGQIADAVSRFAGRMTIGAGTILDPRQVWLTEEAGGRFIISPNTDPEVINATREAGLVSIPGALTPTEAALAVKSGADFVKLFPAGRMGPGYLRDLAAPLSHIRFLAVGGINAENLADYAAAGAVGFGISGGILDRLAIAAGDYGRIKELAAGLTAAAKAAYAG
ncbi:MAG: bifunctional 4-hydroxy-2-oxoglutarate aldolase/2-dehydro-3-deoxy-phosphogluconate aldolase [Clostridia bacterium]|nr:bifunctional 4-hydroxy-2-oxoglutarate aldolase/2-dehydro-3-deoxy-phosphogluconate aldolase [Clostridia bacterium]